MTFKIKDLSILQYFLGKWLEIDHVFACVKKKYVLDLLSLYGLLGCKSSIVPIEENLRLDDQVTNGDPLLKHSNEYKKFVSKLT